MTAHANGSRLTPQGMDDFLAGMQRLDPMWTPVVEMYRQQVKEADLQAGRVDPAATVDELLARSLFDAANPPALPIPLFSLAENVIATPENLMVIQAKMKAGKSAAIGAMLAAVCELPGDCLGFTASNPKAGAVIHFDTEQSRYQHHRLVANAMRRVGLKVPPPWLYSHHVKGYSIAEMRGMIARRLEVAAQKHGSIHCVFLDGIADLCADVNDQSLSNTLVAEVEALAMKYHTLIVCVIHENQGSDAGKTRGHLGSQLARKAETNLRLDKDAEGVTVMYADTSRSCHITKANGPRFRWDPELKSHSSTVSVREVKVSAKISALEAVANECFRNDGGLGLTYTQLITELMEKTGRAKATAGRAFTDMLGAKLIKPDGKKYRRA